jgi:acylphosphatase
LSEPVRRRVVVHGRVQGVFFRDTVRRMAAERDVAGWVQNRSDGALEAVFEGEHDAVEALVSFSRRGPPAAEVREVESFAEPVQGASGFEVR